MVCVTVRVGVLLGLGGLPACMQIVFKITLQSTECVCVCPAPGCDKSKFIYQHLIVIDLTHHPASLLLVSCASCSVTCISFDTTTTAS